MTVAASLSAVQEFSTRMQPEISLFEQETFGRFQVTPNIIFNRDNPHINYQTDDGISVKVDLEFTPKVVQISSIAVAINNEWWSVDRYNIICRTNPDHERESTFPAWELRWAHHAARPERIGNLEHIAYSFAANRGGFYNYEGIAETRFVYGVEGSAVQFPESLRGAAEFQQRQLNWNLDTNAKEQEIINRSAIYEFLGLVPFRL